MRKTRFMSLLFLAWAVAFFCLPDFRQGLESWLLLQAMEGTPGWFERQIFRPTFQSAEEMKEVTRIAEQQHDARTIAYAAMHGPIDPPETLRLAEEAVQLDPSLKAIYPQIYERLRGDGKPTPEAKKVVALMEAADPDNAMTYLIAAQDVLLSKYGWSIPDLAVLSQEIEWRQLMEKGFRAPRYDNYAAERFEINRTWLLERHLDSPARIVLMEAAEPIPNLLNIRNYLDLLVKKLGKDAETAGHDAEALGYYWEAAHMGDRMVMSSSSLFERLIGTALETASYKAILPLLKKQGRSDEAESVETALKAIDRRLSETRGKNPLTHTTSYAWSAMTVGIFGLLVAVSGAASLICFLYVNAKRWIRPAKRGLIFQVMTTAENYAPILFFGASAGFYLSYYPYASNYHFYMTAPGPFADFEPLIYNILPGYEVVPASLFLPPADPFRQYFWYALVALLVGAAIYFPWRSQRSKESKP